MVILPLAFMPGDSANTLALSGEESYDLLGLDQLKVNGICHVHALREDGTPLTFTTMVRIETESELECYLAGGILHEAFS
jgi:aconitate hydratase